MRFNAALLYAISALVLSGCGGGGGGATGTPSSNSTPPTTSTPTVSTPATPSTTTPTPTATAIVPIAVQASSYLNAKNINIDTQVLPALPFDPTKTNNDALSTGIGFADFYQDGKLSMFGASSIPSYTNSTPGKLYFFQKDDNGNWVDHTAKLLTDTTGCIAPRKVLIADFNGDGKPDIFVSCHGMDSAPFPGERPRILLSQPDGTYKNTAGPITCFCHGAAAAEMNSKGYADIVVYDTSVAKEAIFLINNKDGTFTPQYQRLPVSTNTKPIFTVELIDFYNTGKYDLFLAGNEPPDLGDWATTIIPNDGTNSFLVKTPVVLPSDYAYGMPQDIVYDHGFVYLLRICIATGATFYKASEVQKIDLNTMSSSIILKQDIATTTKNLGPWMMPYKGKLLSVTNDWSLSVTE